MTGMGVELLACSLFWGRRSGHGLVAVESDAVDRIPRLLSQPIPQVTRPVAPGPTRSERF